MTGDAGAAVAGRPEFSRIVRVHDIGTLPRTEQLAATEVERAALAARFGLLALDRLEATLALVARAGGIAVTGEFRGAGTQPCAVSAEPVPFDLAEPVELLFGTVAVPDAAELELSVPDLDTLPLDGDDLDLGEAVAQSLGLALDPYPRAPAEVRADAERFLLSEEAAAARIAADKAAANPFGVLRR